ncbi:MAG: PAS domain-containing protein [Limisphaerales bacterium]
MRIIRIIGFCHKSTPKMPVESKPRVLRHWKHRTPFRLDFRFRSKDGKYRWLEARGQATWDKEERPVHFAGHLSDIHERKLTTERIQLRVKSPE